MCSPSAPPSRGGSSWGRRRSSWGGRRSSAPSATNDVSNALQKQRGIGNPMDLTPRSNGGFGSPTDLTPGPMGPDQSFGRNPYTPTQNPGAPQAPEYGGTQVSQPPSSPSDPFGLPQQPAPFGLPEGEAPYSEMAPNGLPWGYGGAQLPGAPTPETAGDMGLDPTQMQAYQSPTTQALQNFVPSTDTTAKDQMAAQYPPTDYSGMTPESQEYQALMQNRNNSVMDLQAYRNASVAMNAGTGGNRATNTPAVRQPGINPVIKR